MAKQRKPMQLQNLAHQYVAEFLKCRSSFPYFCTHYVYLELPGKDVLFQPYAKQTELIDTITLKKYVLVLKSRQIGISTVIQAYAAWLATFYDNVVIGIISKDGAEATDFARVIRGIVEKLPDWMKPTGGLLGRGFAKRTERSFMLHLLIQMHLTKLFVVRQLHFWLLMRQHLFIILVQLGLQWFLLFQQTKCKQEKQIFHLEQLFFQRQIKQLVLVNGILRDI